MTLVYCANGMPPASSFIPWHTHGHHWHGYWIGNDNSYHPASYKHTSKSLHGLSPPTRVKATTNAIYMCDNSSMLTLCPLLHTCTMI